MHGNTANTAIETTPTIFLIGIDERIEQLLSSMGVQINVFQTAEEFLTAADLKSPGCIVCDMHITAGISGIGLLKTLRSRSIDLTVVLVTRVSEISLAVQAVSEGAVTLLSVNCDAQQLFDSVNRALQLNRIRRHESAARAHVLELIARLSDKESLVLKLIVEGRQNKEIAQDLSVSVRSVENWRKSALEKMNILSSIELLRALMHAGFRAWPTDEQT